MKHQTVIGITIFVLLLAACATPIATTTPTLMTVMPTSMPPTTTTSDVRLLFVYSPGCPHCAYQTPIVAEFEEGHPEVEVIEIRCTDLNLEQEGLVAGISGHPVMVFYAGNHVRRIVGETSMTALEGEYEAFKDQLSGPANTTITSGSYSI